MQAFTGGGTTSYAVAIAGSPHTSRNDTESLILDAAREALAEEPFERITIDAIARRAYVSRTALYFYFPTSER